MKRAQVRRLLLLRQEDGGLDQGVAVEVVGFWTYLETEQFADGLD